MTVQDQPLVGISADNKAETSMAVFAPLDLEPAAESNDTFGQALYEETFGKSTPSRPCFLKIMQHFPSYQLEE